MKIKKIVSQHRRDFTAIMVCEHCKKEERLSSGYDDSYYHNNVIPKMKCTGCNKASGDDYVPNTPKYGTNQVV